MSNLDDITLSEQEQQVLLAIARDSLEKYTHSGARVDVAAYELTPLLLRQGGAFVSLHRQGRLRGCIGYIQSNLSLAQTVAENAVNAGHRDPRFDPVQTVELPEIDIEISALLPGIEEGSPFIPVADVSEILIGRDGLFLRHLSRHREGLLLPQVPVEQGWDLDAYLRGICMKAGVPSNAWQENDCQLSRFRAQVFGEKQAERGERGR